MENNKKIAVYCASSTQIDDCYFQDAYRLGQLMAEQGITLVNGAGNMGLMAGLAGVLTLARMAQGNPTFGQAYEMDAIAACFIGGASAYGGIGSVPGMVVGAILLGVINQGMSIMGMSTNYQSVVKGLVLLVAVMFDVVSKKKE